MRTELSTSGLPILFLRGWEFQKEDFREYCLENIPLGRIGQPNDVVGAAVYLASNASDLVTGHVLVIDGGWTAH